MEGYKLPKKKPNKRRSRLVSGGNVQKLNNKITNTTNNNHDNFEGKMSDRDTNNRSNSIGSRPSPMKNTSNLEEFRARQKKAQLDAMMAELEEQSSSDDDDNDMTELRRYTAKSGGFGTKNADDDDLKRQSDNFGKERNYSIGDSGDYGNGSTGLRKRTTSNSSATTMEDLHKAEFGGEHGFNNKSAARGFSSSSSDEEEEGQKKNNNDTEEDEKFRRRKNNNNNNNNDGDEGKNNDGGDNDDDNNDDNKKKKGGMFKRFSLKKSSKKNDNNSDNNNDQPKKEKSEKKKKKKKKKEKEKEGPKVLDPDHMRRWLTRACREYSEKPTQFYIERKKKKIGQPIYRVYTDTDGKMGKGSRSSEFMMMGQRISSKSRKGNYYLMTLDEDEIDRSSNLVLGKLRGNYTGSEYYIYDHGMRPGDVSSEESIRRELGVIFCSYDKMGPGEINFVIPTPGFDWKAFNEPEDKIGEQYKDGNTKNLICGKNKRPKWDEQAGGHVLNFHGRVTQSSVKNFQLVCDLTGEQTVLQFGRVDKDVFTLDVRYPLSPVQAFALVLSSLDKKMADSSVYGIFNNFGNKKNEKGGNGGGGGKNNDEEDNNEDNNNDDDDADNSNNNNNDTGNTSMKKKPRKSWKPSFLKKKKNNGDRGQKEEAEQDDDDDDDDVKDEAGYNSPRYRE